MEIRRAILLFAIVLGLAALVTSISRPVERDEEQASGEQRPESSPERAPGGSRGAAARAATRPAAVTFEAGADPQVRRLQAGRAASLAVDVLAPGQVAIEDLGLDSAAEPGTPARFEVLLDEPGRHAISFTPANGRGGRTIGVLRVRE